MDKQPQFRTNFFSNPAVQGKIILLFFALAILLIATSWIMGLRALNTFGQAAMDLPVTDGAQNDIQLLMEQQRAVLISQLTVYSILSLSLVFLGAALISHHIGGPLYNLVSYCRGVARGEVKPQRIHFRKHDIPKDVAVAFNEFQECNGIVPKEDLSQQPADDK